MTAAGSTTATRGPPYRLRVHIEHTALIVENYDDAIRFFVDALGFDLVEDSPAATNDGRPKRWVVVRPPEAQTGLLLAEADGERQVDAIGRQYAGRVGLFLRVDDFEAARLRMLDHGVEFVTDLATRPTAVLPCSSTSQETDGISSDRRVPEAGLPLIAKKVGVGLGDAPVACHRTLGREQDAGTSAIFELPGGCSLCPRHFPNG